MVKPRVTLRIRDSYLIWRFIYPDAVNYLFIKIIREGKVK